EQAAQIIRQLPSATDVRVEQMSGLPTLSVTPKRDHLALLGLTVSDIQQSLQQATGGIQVGLIYEGDKRFPLIIRMADDWRGDLSRLVRLPVDVPASADPDLRYVPLAEVADLTLSNGPNQINRESGKRNVIISANVGDGDLGSFVAAVQQALRQQLTLPAGYWIGYGGSFEQ